VPDPILLWNEVALEANRVSHTNGKGEQAGPPLSARALAIVHLAMYDAYAGIVQGPELPRYDPAGPAAPRGADPSAAVAAAAHLALTTLFPSQHSFFDSMLAGAGNPSDPGHKFGQDVAKAMLADRQDDPGAGSTTYRPSPDRGHHRPDPDNQGQGFHAPDYGRRSKGFGIRTRLELAAPPQPGTDTKDKEYRAALRQVRSKGIKPELMGTLPNPKAARTPNETLVGLYWGYDGAAELGTPPRLYNQIVREVVRRQENSTGANARLFAFLNVALADAGILAWDQKYIHDFWRPIVGIREDDTSMGPSAAEGHSKTSEDCDALWLPLGAPNTNRIAKNFTPPFPAYPSGHATFGAAAFHITRLFYGKGGTYKARSLRADDLFKNLTFVSEELNGVSTDNTGATRPRHVRLFPGGLWEMIEENGRSRVFLGVHWVFDSFVVNAKNEPELYRTKNVGGKNLPLGGVPLGLLVAEDIFFDEKGNARKAPGKSKVGPRTELVETRRRTETYASEFRK
jgi:Vanadium chloroperoxidase N-terminal domain